MRSTIIDADQAAMLHYNNQQQLPMWTVYRPTTIDFPGKWVCRLFISLPESGPTEWCFIEDSLEAIRAKLPPGLYRLGRDPNDEPVIEETWV